MLLPYLYLSLLLAFASLQPDPLHAQLSPLPSVAAAAATAVTAIKPQPPSLLMHEEVCRRLIWVLPPVIIPSACASEGS